MPTLEDFETGNLNQWSTVESAFNITTNSFLGTYAGGTTSSSSGPRGSVLPLGTNRTEIEDFSFYWKEGSSQSGWALSFYNSNGNREFSVGSNNPQWTTDDANTTGNNNNFYSPGNYNTWTSFDVTFDWSDGTYSLTGDQVGITSQTYNGAMYHGVDVTEISVGSTPTSDWGGNGSNFTIDELVFTPGPLVPVTGVSVSSTTDTTIDLSWDSMDSALGYRVYRSESSGSKKSDYTQIADISSTSYTDSGLEAGERYYYRVTQYN